MWVWSVAMQGVIVWSVARQGVIVECDKETVWVWSVTRRQCGCGV